MLCGIINGNHTGPALGILLTQLIVDGETDISLDKYSLDRFKKRQNNEKNLKL